MTGATPEVSGPQPRPEEVAEALRAGRPPSELVDEAGTDDAAADGSDGPITDGEDPPAEVTGGGSGTDSRGSL